MTIRFLRNRKYLFRWFAYLVIAALLLISLKIHDRLYREAFPYAVSMLEIEAKSQCEELMAESMRYFNSDCEAYILYERDVDNRIESIRINAAKLNLLKAEITSLLITELEKMASIRINVPLGSITNAEFLFGKGPHIKISLPVKGTIRCDITDSFDEIGINQAIHRTSATVTLDLILLLPDGQTKALTLCEDFELARTVVVGTIPQTVVVR